MYIRKTHDEIQVQGLYCGEWSLECVAESRSEAKQLIREYEENCPSTSFRVKIVRVKNEQEV